MKVLMDDSFYLKMQFCVAILKELKKYSIAPRPAVQKEEQAEVLAPQWLILLIKLDLQYANLWMRIGKRDLVVDMTRMKKNLQYTQKSLEAKHFQILRSLIFVEVN